MKRIFIVLFAAVLFSSCTSSTEGDGRQMHLTNLFDSLIEEQNGETPRKHIYIVAHRANTYKGWQELIPDNSILAIETAIEVGADMVELDVRTTKDSVLVLMHNRTIDETTTGSGKVQDFTYEELLQFDMRKKENIEEGMKVPTLKEALLACKDKIYVNLDCKKVEKIDDFLQIIKECGVENQVMIYGFNKERCDYVTANAPEIALHPYVNNAQEILKFEANPSAKLFQYGYPDYLNYEDGGTMAKAVRRLGFLTYSNILGQDSQLRDGNFESLDRFISSETDFIQTDMCEIVDAYLKEKGLRQ